MSEYISEGTKEERYNDGMILPGFVDGHAHGNLGGSKMLLMCPLNDCKNLDEIRNKLKKFIAEHPEMTKFQGMGWNDADFGANGPTAAMIDDLTDKPIAMIDYGHHSFWLNSAAMKLKNIKIFPTALLFVTRTATRPAVSAKAQAFTSTTCFTISLLRSTRRHCWLFKTCFLQSA